MRKIKSYDRFVNEKMINEFLDPITLAFALGAIGIAFASNISDAYKRNKIAKGSIRELILLKSKADAKVKRFNKTGQEGYAAKFQEESDAIQAQIDSLQSGYKNDEDIINDFEKDKNQRAELERQLKMLDDKALTDVINTAKKEYKASK